MRNIVLFCALGASTSLMVNKMKESAAKLGYECTVAAHPINLAAQLGADADMILLGPQVRHRLDDIKAACPSAIVESIDMMDYGMMNGEKVIKHVMSVLGDA